MYKGHKRLKPNALLHIKGSHHKNIEYIKSYLQNTINKRYKSIKSQIHNQLCYSRNHLLVRMQQGGDDEM